MAQDITDRWRAEVALRESQARLSSIVESAMDAIITIDDENRIVVFNAAAEKMFLCPEAEAIGQRVARFIPEQFLAASQEDSKATGRLSIPMKGIRAGGEEFPIEASMSQVEAGRQRLCTIILRDTTERKRAEAEREQLISQLQEALAKIKSLTGLLPICANCKMIRDKEGNWIQLESYIKSHSEAEFSHGICPECARKLYSGYIENIEPTP
jgi:PAS domain S-box-containing protein